MTFKSTVYPVCFLTSAIHFLHVTHKITRKWSGKYSAYSKYIVGNLGDSNIHAKKKIQDLVKGMTLKCDYLANGYSQA